ncbi:MAG: outer membrane lipoprotein carrier protein LolA [Polyangiaceae bacterium]
MSLSSSPRSRRALAALVMLLVACSSEDGGSGSSSASSGSAGLSATTSSSAPSVSSSPVAPPSVTASTPGTTPTPAPSGSVAPATSGSTKPNTPAPPSTGPVATNPGTTSSTVPTTDPPTPPVVTPIELPPPDPGTADAVAAQIDALYAPLPRYKANFLQKYTQKVQGTEKESKGTVFVERKNKISFRYDAPNLNRIVSDAITLKVYVADDQQMFENPVGNTEYPGAMAFIMGEGIRKSFTFAFNEKVKFEKGPVLIGKPRSPTPAYEKVQFYVDKEKLDKSDLGAVVSVLILDAQGNKNRFEFYDAQQPASIDASEFTFTPPAGTNIAH